MELILWRHARAVEPDEHFDDLKRPLTPQGERQAADMAAWLKRHLPAHTRILCSPALRTRQTAMHLGKRSYLIAPELAPEGDAQALLKASGWPDGSPEASAVLLVGHQPALGEAAQLLLGMHEACAIRKGAVWWLQQRRRGESLQVVLRTVQHPGML